MAFLISEAAKRLGKNPSQLKKELEDGRVRFKVVPGMGTVIPEAEVVRVTQLREVDRDFYEVCDPKGSLWVNSRLAAYRLSQETECIYYQEKVIRLCRRGEMKGSLFRNSVVVLEDSLSAYSTGVRGALSNRSIAPRRW